VPLTTYTASAGSGKTYALTREYLRLLLAAPAANAAYRQLLAITFTNKAADEMKSRIMERLHVLACSTEKELSAFVNPDVALFCELLKISPTELQERAQAAQAAILHDYSHFAVSTIDAFFQKIVRVFLHEMGLLPGFALELDNDRLLDEAVDALWNDAADDEALLVRLIDLTNQRLDEGRSWDARKPLKEIGVVVFKESFRNLGGEFRRKIGDADFLKSYEKKLTEVTGSFVRTMQDCGRQALQTLAAHGIAITDFKYKAASFANYFNKIVRADHDANYEPGVRVLEALHNEKKWLTDDAAKDAVVREVIYPSLNPLLERAVTCYEKQYTNYCTARAILKNLYSMALLADVANKVTTIANEENVLLLSDTLYLLHELVGDSHTPFVFEKTGVYYRSFLLDEFQDTSKMQWESLRPLLLNGISEGGEVLAVGDVKQSIYRWRNGDWRILAHGLYDYFKTFPQQQLSLDINWRSREVIVETNNTIFSRLPQLVQQKLETGSDTVITDAYREATQHVSPEKVGTGGYVRIETVRADEPDDISSREKVLQRLPLLVAELQDRGYRASDIAVLVRYGREGQEVANALLQHKQTSGDTAHCFEVVSPDSLFLSHAPVVQFVMAVLQCALDSSDAINRAVAERYLGGTKMPEIFLRELLYLPLPEAMERIIKKIKLNENSTNWSFLQELHDRALAFANAERSDIYSFVQHWNKTGREKYTLAMSDSREAVRIMTIHKSKGLQYRAVIVPFCNWSLEPKSGSLLWVKADQEPFVGPGYLPLNYSSALAKTCFNADYQEERMQSAIDNLNLLYVAFTRAEDELYAFVPQGRQRTAQSFATLLPELLETDCFEAGTPIDKAQQAVQRHVTSGFQLQSYPSEPYANKLRVKYTNEQATDNQLTPDFDSAVSVRDYGILMHRAFSYIATPADVNKAVEKLIMDGFLTNEEQQSDHLKALLHGAFKQHGVGELFDGSWRLVTEMNVLMPAGNTDDYVQLRPDRVLFRNDEVVVVDYKFGTTKQPQHLSQVERYVECIKQMGYPKVAGYVWYVTLEDIKLVK